MFQSIDEVIAYFQQKYQETGNKYIRVTVPGASSLEIHDLETELGVQIPPSLKYVLQKVEWSDNFTNLYFADTHTWRHQKQMNELWGWPGVKETGYWEAGSSDGYFVFVKSDTGEVFVQEVGYRIRFKYADNFEQFVCIAASIVTHEWPDSEQDVDIALAAFEEFIKIHSISGPHNLWRDLAMGWA